MDRRPRRRAARRVGPRLADADRPRLRARRALRHPTAEPYRRGRRTCRSRRRAPQEDGGGMELRPGYKQTDAGPIPADWGTRPLGELFTFRNGVNADKRSYGQGIRFINVLEPITHSHLHGPEIPGR